jgi:hypothetical protein
MLPIHFARNIKVCDDVGLVDGQQKRGALESFGRVREVRTFASTTLASPSHNCDTRGFLFSKLRLVKDRTHRLRQDPRKKPRERRL